MRMKLAVAGDGHFANRMLHRIGENKPEVKRILVADAPIIATGVTGIGENSVTGSTGASARMGKLPLGNLVPAAPPAGVVRRLQNWNKAAGPRLNVPSVKFNHNPRVSRVRSQLSGRLRGSALSGQ
jgi:hypothetical protein